MSATARTEISPAPGAGERARELIRVHGIVQGVGFRPFVYALADRFDLAGQVGNDSDGVFLDLEGPPAALAAFRAALLHEAPPLAVIAGITAQPAEPTGRREFAIAISRQGEAHTALVAPDTATCEDCLRELFDPADRRYGYAFTNCTNCGPRFTIIQDTPYDRAMTTMSAFTMCPACEAEYLDPTNRRFHAEPTCCPACGPRLRLIDRAGGAVSGNPITETARLLATGAIVAVKGLGGYHLAADAGSQTTLIRLRERKHREEKPFAVLVADLEAARGLVEMSSSEEQVLAGRRRPIVLLRARRPGAPSLAEAVAPGNRELGLMLPYTPLHHLLARAFGRPLVLTSGNLTDEPIVYDDTDALDRLSPVADYFLTHDRRIHMRTDDSVVRVVGTEETLLRRARGYAPQPISLAAPLRRPVLACGAELKNTFCLAKDATAFLSPHIGDLENYASLRSYLDGIDHVRRLFDIEPQLVAYDLHPDYLSTKHALELEDVDLIGVQHHHAHIASCLADNQHPGPVIGVAFDGLGYGTDGTLWGGEFLVAGLESFERRGHLAPVPLPGGAAAIREPWRMAASYLVKAYGDAGQVADLEVAHRHREHWQPMVSLAQGRANAPLTSSAGRLFDAVAALIGVRDVAHYEGQAAIELEQIAAEGDYGSYPVAFSRDAIFQIAGADLVRAVVEDLRAGVEPARISARFHQAVVDLVTTGCLRIAAETGLSTVALSGGVFQNQRLLHGARQALQTAGMDVLVHHRVPANDGGISLGQLVVAGAADRRR